MAGARRVKSKVKKKIWVPVIAPPVFREQVIGDTNVLEPNQALGKILPVNVMNLTGDARKQNIIATFEIIKVSGDKAYTSLLSLRMMASSIKRMVRRGKSKVDYSFMTKTQDNKNVRLKVLLLTRNLTQKSVLTAMRKWVKTELTATLSKTTYEKFVSEILGHKLQMDIKKKLAKIYPLKSVEIREASLVKDKKQVVDGKIVEEEPVEEKKEPVVEESNKEVKEPVVEESKKEVKEPVVEESKKEVKEPVVEEKVAKKAPEVEKKPAETA